MGRGNPIPLGVSHRRRFPQPNPLPPKSKRTAAVLGHDFRAPRVLGPRPQSTPLGLARKRFAQRNSPPLFYFIFDSLIFRRLPILKFSLRRIKVFQDRVNLLGFLGFSGRAIGGLLLFGTLLPHQGGASVIRPCAASGHRLLLGGGDRIPQVRMRGYKSILFLKVELSVMPTGECLYFCYFVIT